jgi:predicted AlkP superfamily phosphohydrolase/phosphomutase
VENENKGAYRQDSVFSKKVRAGKRRTYFFDVKATKSNDYFLTITESKKRMDDTYERFKIFVYKEDLNKFLENLTETIDHIRKELMPDFDFDAFSHKEDYNEYQNSLAASNAGKEVAAENITETPTSESTSENETILSSSDASASEIPKAENNPAADVNDDDLKW